MTASNVAPESKKLIKLATKKLKGPERRAFMAEVAETLCFGSPRLTETEFGFNRQAKLEPHILRHSEFGKWDVTIAPEAVCS